MAGLVNRQRFGSTIDRQLFTSVHKLSNETRIPFARLLEEGLVLLLMHHGREVPDMDYEKGFEIPDIP